MRDVCVSALRKMASLALLGVLHLFIWRLISDSNCGYALGFQLDAHPLILICDPFRFGHSSSLIFS